MTHDELLEELDGIIKDFDQKYDNSNPYYKALRAVVELAATYKDGNYVNEEFNQGLQTAFQLIIEAIDKELSE
jgi:hypothetical protein